MFSIHIKQESKIDLHRPIFIFPKQPMFYFILAFIFYAGSSEFIRLNSIFRNFFDVFYLIVCIFYFIKAVTKKRINTYIWTVFLFYICQGISTLMGVKSFSYIHYMLQAMAATFFVNDGMYENPKCLIEKLRDAALLILIINILCLMVKPYGFFGSGNTAFYFLGFRIAFTPYAFVAVVFSFIDDMYKKCAVISKITIFTIALSVFTVVIKTVSTGMVCVTLFTLVVLSYKQIPKRLVNIWLVYIVYTVFFLGVVVFGIQTNWKPLAFILTDVLQKDVTFNNRTYIWASAIKHFLANPIWGYGINPKGGIYVNFVYQSKYTTAHNQILNILCDGGIVSLISFITIFINMGYNIRCIYDKKKSVIATFSIMFMLFIMITEIQITKSIIFLLFGVITNLFRTDVLIKTDKYKN